MKKILIGITGSIAAYKSADLIRLLKEANADVRVIMTENSKNFITPLTLSALAMQRIYDSLMHDKNPMIHIELARWADLVVIAPASANFIAKLAHGFADDLLSTVCIATQAPIVIAPAMNQQMWENSITQKNIRQLNHIHIIGPAAGIQACGENGYGRMLEPEDIKKEIEFLLQQNSILAGKKIVITAGATQEAIDPVRYISNHSSGKMGYALAEAAAKAGADVILISGPSFLACCDKIQRIDVISAQQMLDAVLSHMDCDIFIAAAAVADYRPEVASPQKIKKTDAKLELKLIPNVDILATAAKFKPKPYLVGFAAETENLIANARKKYQEKNLDMIIVNEVNKSDRGFNSDFNEVTVITSAEEKFLPYAPKSELAKQLIGIIAANVLKNPSSPRKRGSRVLS